MNVNCQQAISLKDTPRNFVPNPSPLPSVGTREHTRHGRILKAFSQKCFKRLVTLFLVGLENTTIKETVIRLFFWSDYPDVSDVPCTPNVSEIVERKKGSTCQVMLQCFRARPWVPNSSCGTVVTERYAHAGLLDDSARIAFLRVSACHRRLCRPGARNAMSCLDFRRWAVARATASVIAPEARGFKLLGMSDRLWRSTSYRSILRRSRCAPVITLCTVARESRNSFALVAGLRPAS